MPAVATVTTLLSYLTVIGDAMVVGLVVLLVGFLLLRQRKGVVGKLMGLISRNALWMALVVATIATAGSLFYSEVAKFEPCKLCWLQRIFMYPLVVILGIAAYRDDRRITAYVLPLSAIGAAIAGYHYALQVNPGIAAPCSAVGYAVSCSQRFVMNLGYVTIPMMSLTAFLLIGLLMVALLLSRTLHKSNESYIVKDLRSLKGTLDSKRRYRKETARKSFIADVVAGKV